MDATNTNNTADLDDRIAGLQLFLSGDSADSMVICGQDGQVWDTHRAILQRCPYFRAALSPVFKEGQTGIILFNDIGSKEISIVLKFIYSGIVNINYAEHSSAMITCNKIAHAADYFELDTLKYHGLGILKAYFGAQLAAICQGLPVWTPYVPNLNFKALCVAKYQELVRVGFEDCLCAAVRHAYQQSFDVEAICHAYVDFVCAARMHTFRSKKVHRLAKEVSSFGSDILKAMKWGDGHDALDAGKVLQLWAALDDLAADNV
ncbi:hypothetical protein M406DRAFT_332288 [Cryphonectria parasitica EP155]|uniref:BTB domain-containing protein n=1 Tax=Cryphonectria parasitica (strain ATCC 38755 / EP155) TaxID=660469 RepID=A0A9P4XZM9_CRYP1|nr:uncharacterized protein M406DRAFT_332288 [Cryphonectria parasitica EP155]KAF3763841.1 hypothetical protein M406DRAFT_332288 [Cryphonectria parasitica EP155]